ncbi:hypothetical protein LTR86_008003 [Recurvomyces mirabilis]|nr:hypothetical protein LTR86_008003 [Recurvomyces mirabilis]
MPPEWVEKQSAPPPGDCVYIPTTPVTTPPPSVEYVKVVKRAITEEEMFRPAAKVCDKTAGAAPNQQREPMSIGSRMAGPKKRKWPGVLSRYSIMGPPPPPTQLSKTSRTIVTTNGPRGKDNSYSSATETELIHKPHYQQRINRFVQTAQHPSKSRPSKFSTAHCEDILRNKGVAGVFRKVTPSGRRAFQQLDGELNPLINDSNHGTAPITRDPDYRELVEMAKRARAEFEEYPSRVKQQLEVQNAELPSSILGDDPSGQEVDYSPWVDFDADSKDEVPMSKSQDQDHVKQAGPTDGIHSIEGTHQSSTSSQGDTHMYVADRTAA